MDYDFGSLAGLVFGLLCTALGWRHRVWRRIRFEYDSGNSDGPAFQPTPQEVEYLQRIRLQGSCPPLSLSSGGGQRELPSENEDNSPTRTIQWLDPNVRRRRKDFLSLVRPRSRSSLSTATSSLQSSPIRKSVVRTESSSTQTEQEEVAPPTATTSSVGSQTEQHRPEVADAAVQAFSVLVVPTPKEEVAVQTTGSTTVHVSVNIQTTPAVVADAQTQEPATEFADAETQTEAVGAAGRWQRLVYIVRRVSFLRRTKFVLNEYVKDFNGIYTRAPSSGSGG